MFRRPPLNNHDRSKLVDSKAITFDLDQVKLVASCNERIERRRESKLDTWNSNSKLVNVSK